MAFSIGKYRDMIFCDVVLMHVGHLLLGRPWQYDRKVQHDGFQNHCSSLMEGRVITLVPPSPRDAHEDQLKTKRESGKSSAYGSPKERVERIAYCSNHVYFQRKLKKRFPILSIMREQRFDVESFSRGGE